MFPQRIIAVVVLVIGVVLLVIGLNSTHSFADQISDLFRGRWTDSTMWYIVGGIVVALVGLSMTVVGTRRKVA